MLLSLAIALSLPQTVPQEPPVRKSSLTGTIKVHPDFESKLLGNKRHIWVYLPPGYDAEPKRRYPVLYLNDGQNVFDGMTSYLPNLEWRCDEAAEALIAAKAIEPIVMVGVSNAQMARADEYLPTRRKFRDNEFGGKADLYGRFLTDEVMPFVNKAYRTKTGGKNTALCGSSFGGVVTLWLGLTRPEAFGRLAVVSPSVWWDERLLIKKVEALGNPSSSPADPPGARNSFRTPVRGIHSAPAPRFKIWLDMGTDEGPGAVKDTLDLRDSLVKKGWTEGKDLLCYIDSGAKHNEAAWANRFPAMLLWLFGR